jgi:hypothetical protein
MSGRRRSRFKKTSIFHRKSIYLGQKDIEILGLFGPGPFNKFNYLTSDLIAAVTGRPLNRVQHRMRDLYDHGYLNRYHPPYERIGGSSKSVYLLDKLGAAVLSEHLDEHVKYNRDFDINSYHQHMEHILLTNWFRVLTIAACRDYNGAELQYHYPDHYFRLKFGHQKNKKNFTVEPDLLFGISKIGYPSDVSNFYVEIHRPSRKAKESSRKQINTIAKKLTAYKRFWEHEVYKSIDNEDYPDIRNWKNMRVLMVTDVGYQEHENLISLARKIDDRGKGLRLFWFARKQDFDLNKPETLFNAVWKTPIEGDGTKSIFD